MAYIGRQPQIGNFQICDAISTVNAQAAYTMQVGSVNVLPETANHMIVSLNGVIQAPITSYTVSGSTITFAANLVTGDVINFIQILGDVLDLGVPSDGTVTSGKLATNAVTTVKITDANVTTAKITDNAITLAKMVHGTDGNIISYDANGAPVAVATGNDGMVLTSAGAGAPPAFEAIAANAGTLDFQSDRTSDLTINVNTLTEIVFNGEAIDTGGKYNTSNGRYTPAVAGNYFVHASVSCEPNGDHDQAEQTFFKIRKNGVDTEFGQVSCSGAATDQHFSLSTTAIITLDGDDYISVWMYTQRALKLFSDQCSFNGFRLS